MTFDILLVALAALVLSNVVLLVAAARSGTLGQPRNTDRTPPTSPIVAPRLPVQPAVVHAAERPMSAIAPAGGNGTADHTPVEPASVADIEPARDAEAAAVTASAPVSDTREPSEPPERSEPSEPPKQAKPSKSAAASATAAPVAGRTRAVPARTGGVRGGRGRRFTLPSIEVDHARTERVVLSLLTGDDEVPPGEMVDAWERMVGTDADSTARRSAVVVALTLDGLDLLTEAAGRDGAERVVGTVLDAIRRSARGSDRVASVGRGHFRVLLVDADEAVAMRFVGRVRESTERRLVMAGAPVTLAAGWSEAASADRLEGAVRTAEERRRADAAAGRRRTGGSNPA